MTTFEKLVNSNLQPSTFDSSVLYDNNNLAKKYIKQEIVNHSEVYHSLAQNDLQDSNCNSIQMCPIKSNEFMQPEHKHIISIFPEKPYIQKFSLQNSENLSNNSETIQREESTQFAPRTDTRYGLGIRNRFGLYDATLNRDTSTLTLQMRIAFNFTGRWPSDTVKAAWFREFKRLVENRWSYRYYLVPDGTCRYSEDQRTYFARLNVEQVTSNPHFNVDVAYTTTHLPSSANSVSRTATLDSMDIEERVREHEDLEYRQRGVEHEFGHLLGVSHVECDVVTGICPAGDQYGDTPEEATDIMGIGWVITERNYYPFTTAMYYFTGSNWRASHQMYYP